MRRKEGKKKGIIKKKGREEKKEEYNEGKVEGEGKRKDNGKKAKYLRGDKEAGNLQKKHVRPGLIEEKGREEKKE